jgi:hypothetical protein
MDEDNWITFALVDVVHLETIAVEVVGFERPGAAECFLCVDHNVSGQTIRVAR